MVYSSPMSDLAQKHCVPCKQGASPLTGAALEALVDQLPGWEVVDDHHLSRVFTFSDFKGALSFVNRVGEVAEAEGHHPDISFTWGRVKIEIWTHKINGLTESDFVLAAKCDGVVD